MIVLLAVLLILLVLLPLIGITIGTLVSVAVVGAIMGGIARLILPGRQQIGVIATILLGWIGSLIGGYIGDHLLNVGWLPTVLLEIAVTVGLVALASSRAGRDLARRHRTLRY